MSAREDIEKAIEQTAAELASTLATDQPPDTAKLRRLRWLTQVRDALPRPEKGRAAGRMIGAGATLPLALILVWLAWHERAEAGAELDILTSYVSLTLDHSDRQDILVPGEQQEAVKLRRALVAKFDRVDGTRVPDGEVRVRSFNTPGNDDSMSIRLQQLALPPSLRSVLVVEANPLFDHGFGLTASSSGASLTLTQPVKTSDPTPSLVPRPSVFSGDKLQGIFEPWSGNQRVTIARDIRIHALAFAPSEPGPSAVRGGQIHVSDHTTPTMTVLSGHKLKVVDNDGMFLRAITFSDGVLRVLVHIPSAEVLSSGDQSPRSLKPSWLDWLRARWPSQLYATLGAILALVFTLQRWWKAPS